MSSCHMLRVIAMQVLAAATLLSATVVVRNETVPPGATVQLKFSLAKPALLSGGELVIDLDPTVFASVTTACAFSANGDANGLVRIKGLHVDVKFGSPSGGIGQLVDVPVVTVTAVVLPAAAVGKTATVTPDPTASPWTDPQQNIYAVDVLAGTVTVGGPLSITSVTPGGGILPNGTAVEIDGTGFSTNATVQIDGASIASVQVANPGKILVTLGGTTELTGKRIRVTNPDGSNVDMFPFLPGTPLSLPGTDFDGIVPIMPLQTYTVATFFAGGSASFGALAIRNPNPGAVQVLLNTTNSLQGFIENRFLTVPSGSSISALTKQAGSSGSNFLIVASAPVQIAEMTGSISYSSAPSVLGSMSLSPALVPPLQLTTDLQNGALSWIWQTGSPTPAPQSVNLRLPRGQAPTNVSVNVTTSSGGNWLSVTPSGAIAVQPDSPTSLQVSVNPASLAPGIYRGTVTLTPVATAFFTTVEPLVIPVAITVTAQALQQTVITPKIYLSPKNTSAPVTIPTGLFPGTFALNVLTDSGGNWLAAIPNAATAPTSISITTSAAAFGVGSYSGDIVLSASGSTLVVPIQYTVEGSIRLVALAPNGGTLDSLQFSAQSGSTALPDQLVGISNEDCPPSGCVDTNPDLSSVAASVATHTGGNWLSATVSNGAVRVSANATGLTPGVYVGSVTLSASGFGANQFPVILLIRSSTTATPALVAGPGLLTFDVDTQSNSLYGTGPARLCVSSGPVPLVFTLQTSVSWLHVTGAGGPTPVCYAVRVDATKLLAGSYSGNIVITGGDQSVTIPVAVTVTPLDPVAPMLIGSVASAASETPTAVSPGEIIAIHGQNLGPMAPVGPSVDANGQFSTNVAGVQVLIGGRAAPILYASQTEINTVVPYEIAGQSTVSFQIQTVNGSTPPWDVPSTTSAPGIFTTDGSGVGAGAILNQDNSVNTPANPAAQGTVVQIFATGEGLTNPAGKTGSLAQGQNLPILPVGVKIGGVQAQVIYAGSAPLEIEGLLQVNIIVPKGITAGSAVPVTLTVGQAQSRAASLAIQ